MTSPARHAAKMRERDMILRALGDKMSPHMVSRERTEPFRSVAEAISTSSSMRAIYAQLDRMRSIQVLMAVMLGIITLNVILFDIGMLYLVVKLMQALDRMQEVGLINGN